MKRYALALIVSLATMGCLPKMRDTKVPSSAGSYSTLETEAQKAGWKAEQAPGGKGAREGGYFYYLKVTTTSGGVLYFTKNNATGNIAFSCKGLVGDECVGAANKLFGPAFGGHY